MDERAGEELDPRLVRQTESEEIAFLKRIGRNVEVEAAECWTNTGRAIHQVCEGEQGYNRSTRSSMSPCGARL